MDVIFVPEQGETFGIEVGFFDTVLEIKEKIEKYHGIPIPKQSLIFNGRILQDHRDVEFCEILQHSRIQLVVANSELSAQSEIGRLIMKQNNILPDPPPPHQPPQPQKEITSSKNNNNNNSSSINNNNYNKLKVMVKPKSGNSKIAMEVNPTDNVGELKKELEKLQQRMQFHLPPEGFFFIYDRDVMDEDRSFRWHGVAHGDTIEIFNGTVTGGS
ncbi:ubiquitin domain-containing protein 7SL RNA1-like [Benincasa hispida]|uniref:ubiquitin domain-containing protein 7SL RNA1-like n=1 Tax=Benincasa hispida TaxID=102211 RepID=UPI0019005C95|nr:ubiquitin domain-containing protein 7SL RNA1-like [Benincasa hispida]